MYRAMFAFLLVLGLSVAAQANDQVIVNLPFQVHTQDKVLEPGQYVIREMNTNTGGHKVLAIYKGGEFQEMVSTNATEDPHNAHKSKLTLQQVGDDFYLSKVWVQGRNVGYQLNLPAAAKSRMKELSAAKSQTAPVAVREVSIDAAEPAEATGR